MARTHRSSSASEHVPKYFGKHGIPQAPNHVKKNGGGRYNWGRDVDDIDDAIESGEFNFAHSHRRSNSNAAQGHPMLGHSKYPSGSDDAIDEF